MSRWLAGGLGGAHPENQFTREPDDGPDKRSCNFCNERFVLSDLARATESNVPSDLLEITTKLLEEHVRKPWFICRKCRGLESRKEKKKQDQKEKKLRKKLAAAEVAEVERKKKDRSKDIESAIDSSDFRTLFRFSKVCYYDPDGEKRATEGLVELLRKLRIDKPVEFNDIAKYIGSKAEQIQGDYKYSQLLSEFFRTLFATYPESFGVAKPGFNRWIENSSSSDTIRSEIMKLDPKEFRRLLDCLPPTQRWKKSTWIEFANLLILHESINEKSHDLLNKLSYEGLQGDSLFSYVVRKNNQSGKMERYHSAGLVRQIRDENRRVLCILSMSPMDFSEFVSHNDFSTIINSPLFSLILSEDQIRHVLEEDSDEEYRVEIKGVIDKLSENLGRFVPSISTKFKNALGEETNHTGDFYTLDKFMTQSWDYYNERVLELVEDKIVAKKITHFDTKPWNKKWEKKFNKSYASFSNRGKPIDDPYKIARCITDFDYSFSEEVRVHLDSMLMGKI